MFTCGGTPIRDAPYTHVGNVFVDPFTKFVITKSSRESTNASRNPATMPGRISGSVTRKNADQRVANRSWAAFSSDRSSPCTRARTVIATNAIENPMWEKKIVRYPSGM